MMLSEPMTIPASDEEQVRELHRLLQLGSPALIDANGARLELPPAIYQALKEIVRQMQQGRSVALIPENQHVTTQRAADLLGASRPHVIKLINSGELPYHMVGSHRRVYLRDVMAFVKRRDGERGRALDRLAREAYEAGLYENTGIPEGGNDE
jgi:excisionase family DNA binding protein